ncbi:MAG: nuclear transport factor 2 family protein [Thermoanaerobaculia bacterium]
MRLPVQMLTALPAFVLSSSLYPGAAAQPLTSSKCAAAEHRRFDFWAGDWDVYDVGGSNKPVARARVDVILGGCALREVYEQTDGLVGQSFTSYDASRKLWHQTWVTNRGELLTIEGRFQGTSLSLEGPRLSADGREERIRGVWTPRVDGVLETAQTSADGGATWRPLFDIIFRPAAVRASAADDAHAVAALDTQYQAAVAKNDAAAMDRILADDFILVTGKGKVFTKADLLNEARGGRYVYERQDDSSQKVRVWGDTAVVTALLWAKGTEDGQPFEYKLWFSDTYVRTASGWRYVFGQASIPLPKSN